MPRVIPIPDNVSTDQISWRVCHASPDYEVSEYGQVRRKTPGRKTWPGRMMSFTLHNAGYPRYKLTISGEHRYFEAHVLVARAFLPDQYAPGLEVAHADGDSSHNHYSNLAWKTHADNEADKESHGTSARGARNGGAKLSQEDVLAIRSLRSQGATLKEIADQFGIAFQTVSKISNKDRWNHI